MKLGIAILPNEEIQQFANSYRKRYDPHYKLIAPHITIKEAFTISSDTDLQTYFTYLENVAKETPSFTLSISKFGTFYPVNNVLYLAIDENETIRTLYQKLQLGEPDEERPYAFTPHITIAQKMDTDELLDVYATIKMSEVKFEFTVDRFHLFQQGEDQVWSIYKTFTLV